MKNNKGFSTVELIVSFALTMAVIVVLFEIIVYMKELYEKSATQAELINKQNLMTDYIYSDLYNNQLINVSNCSEKENCIQFTYNNNQTKELIWNYTTKTISFDNYTINLIKNSELGEATICSLSSDNSTGIDSYFSIHIPITNTLFPNDDFGITILYTYDGSVSGASMTLGLSGSSSCF